MIFPSIDDDTNDYYLNDDPSIDDPMMMMKNTKPVTTLIIMARKPSIVAMRQEITETINIYIDIRRWRYSTTKLYCILMMTFGMLYCWWYPNVLLTVLFQYYWWLTLLMILFFLMIVTLFNGVVSFWPVKMKWYSIDMSMTVLLSLTMCIGIHNINVFNFKQYSGGNTSMLWRGVQW